MTLPGKTFWNQKKVLVTGGAGFIGSHLVEQLLELGATIRVTHLKGESLEFLDAVKSKIELMESDLFEMKNGLKACQGQDIVLNLAARVAGIEFNRKHSATMLRDNMLLQLNVLEAARQSNVKKFLVVSTACVYPRGCTIPTPEEEGFNGEPDPTNSGYGWSKRFGELLGTKYQEEYGMELAIARPYNSYGPRDNFNPKTSHVIPSLIRRVLSDENPLTVWGDGTPTRAFCYVTDFTRGLILCMEKGAGQGPINIGTDDEVSIKQLAELIVKVSGKTPEIVFDTSKPNGQQRRNSDNSRAEKIIGFKAEVSLEEGLKKTIAWYSQNQKND